MLDLVLINPSLFKKETNIWQKIDSCLPSLGLASLAAYSRQQGFQVRIIDAPALKISVEKFGDFLRADLENYRARYYGFTATTAAVKNAYLMAQVVKEIYPEAKIIFGGAHPTVLPEEVVSQSAINLVVVGEGELTLAEVLSGKNHSEVKGLVYRENGRIISNSPRERIKDLDQLPFPAYDLLPMEKYYPAKGSYQRLPAISMLTSRGCPGRCTFCNKTLGEQMVFRSADSLIEEIKMLSRDFGIRQINFYDDTFTVFKENIRRFCQLLLEQKIDISWCCFSRVDYVDLELLKLMKRAGCHQIMYGIESGDEGVLRAINKKIDLATVRTVVKLTKQAKIDVRGAFMIANPTETRETVLRTLKFAQELNPEVAIFNITTPYPGTEMFKEASGQGLIMTYDWDDYDLSKPIMKLENLSQEEIIKLYHYCYQKFYFRPRYVLLRLKRLFTRSGELRLLLESLRALLSFLKS
jgi:radical SAM superfamily enzyme YgiQ (UPF0313 family)